MAVTWIDDDAFEVRNKTVLCRVDMNVPLSDGVVTDDERIRKSLPTIKLLLEKGARLVLCSHLGRPKGKVRKAMSLAPVAERLAELLGDQELIFTDDCVGEGVAHVLKNLEPGRAMLLENLRFHSGEERNDEGFARQLAAGIQVYVNDAFGTAHRAHASTAGVAALVKQTAGGLLLRAEVEALGGLMHHPQRPFVAVLGGAKVSDKVGVLTHLLSRVDRVIIGGAMAYTFLKARGENVGSSRVEADKVSLAAEILKRAQERDVEVLLPDDHVVTRAFAEDADHRVVLTAGIEQDEMGLDIGPRTQAAFAKAISAAKTLFWNGPMGGFEWDAFGAGTLAVAKAVAACPGQTVVGGGDSVAAINKAGLHDAITHVSTGGGASLELLEGKKLPGLVALGYEF